LIKKYDNGFIMNLQSFSHNFNDLEITTNSCLKVVSENCLNDQKKIDLIEIKNKFKK